MEVHHHSHSAAGSDSHRSKKKWTHYFWEFLMLFLAVFCGFLAENQREHFIEHQREKKYAKQLLSDLRADSLFFVKKERRIKIVFEGHQEFKRKIIQQQATDRDVLEGFLQVYTIFDPNLTNTTFSQMKSSGSLRYIRNEELARQLTKYYDVTCEELRVTSNVLRNFLEERLAPWYLKHVRAQDLDDMSNDSAVFAPVIIDRSKATDQEVLNLTEAYRGANMGVSEHMDNDAAKQADVLIHLIKKQYHLK